MAMRFMIMHKTNAHWEAGAVPDEGLIARVGVMIAEMADAGVLVAAEGLRASSHGVRLRFAGGKRTVKKGPFRGSNELPAGFAILKVKSIEEATFWASRFAEVLEDPEIDIRPLTEAWDIGMGPKPEGLTTRRFMVIHKADKNSEAGAPRKPKQLSEMGRLIREMRTAGVLLSTGGLKPSSKGARLNSSGGKRTVTDGPFTESKELIAGFVIVEAAGMKEALEWLLRYAAAVDADEVDILPLAERGAIWGRLRSGKGGQIISDRPHA